jgi:hypothetical protein
MESRGDDEVEATDAAAAGMFVSMAVSPTSAASKDSKCAISLTFQKTTSSSSSCCEQTHHTVLNKLLLQQVPQQQQVSRTVDELRSVFLLLLLLQLLFTHSLTHSLRFPKMIQFFTTSKTHTHTQNKKSSLTQKRINFEHSQNPSSNPSSATHQKKKNSLPETTEKSPRPKTKQNQTKKNPKPEN